MQKLLTPMRHAFVHLKATQRVMLTPKPTFVMAQPVRFFSSNEGVKTLYLDGISHDANTDALKEQFSQFGEITNIHLMQTRNPLTKAFIEFETEEQAKAAVEGLQEVEVEGETVKVQLARARGHPDSKQGRQNRTVYVGNLDYETTEEGLREFFSNHGTVESVSIPTSPEGNQRGFAFVMFSSWQEAREARNVSGSEFNGREI